MLMTNQSIKYNGIGKNYVTSVIGHQACILGIQGIYSMPAVLNSLLN